MKVYRASSEKRPAGIVTGPTVTLYRRDIEERTTTGEDGSESPYYTYIEIRFENGEYEGVRAGILPAGVSEWTEDLRRIERSAYLDEADRFINEANDHISLEKEPSLVTAWTAYRTAVRQYKQAVRDTADAEGFPVRVTYPDLPVQP